MKTAKIHIRFFFVSLCIACIYTSCNKDKEVENPEQAIKVSGIVLPSTMEGTAGQAITLEVIGSGGPVITDKVVLDGEAKFILPITDVSKGSFSFTLSGDVFTGDYDFSILRGSQSKRVGRTYLVVTSGVEIDPGESTVYGQVSCRGNGIEGVVVSDGVAVTATDRDGIYRLKSAKKHGYVFVSVPSGYEVPANGILPQIHRPLSSPVNVAERADFDLTAAPGQDRHTMLIMGDIHLANRTSDRSQFSGFVTDINAFRSSLAGKVYGLTLGDMTWDYYWLVNKYGFKEYLQDANAIKNLQIFHTIGNHDHSMYFSGDFDTVSDYKSNIGPTYYSYNIGKVHYIVLDDVECTNSTAAKDSQGNPCYERSYNANVVNEEIAWLRKDLAYVPATTPLVISMHIPLYNANGNWRMNTSAASTLESILKQYSEVHIFTAHTHVIYNIDRLATDHIFEHNAGAVCATWWWSAKETPGVHICQDGTPGGYTVLEVNGTDFKWQYKATGADTSFQMRAYDRNGITITADKYVPAGDASHKALFDAGTWATADTSNEVYFNVWNYDSSWTLTVTENGTSLPVTRVSVKDPLHLIAYSAKRLNQNKDLSFPTSTNNHTFRVKASSATSKLDIELTDRFGNVYSRSIQLPLTFSTDTYKNNQPN